MDFLTAHPDFPLSFPTPQATLLALPTELLQQVASYLDVVSTAALALSAKPLAHALGSASWSQLRGTSAPQAQRASLVRLLARDRGWSFCESCVALHPSRPGGGLIAARLRRCAASGPADVVGCAALGLAIRVYPLAVAMVFRRLVGGPAAEDSSCAEVLRCGFEPAGRLDAQLCRREVFVGGLRSWVHDLPRPKPGAAVLTWTARYTFTAAEGGLDALVEALMRHEFRACDHMLWEQLFQAAVPGRVDLNNYMFNALMREGPLEPLRCRYCATTVSASARNRRTELWIEVKKLYYGEGERMGRVAEMDGTSHGYRLRRKLSNGYFYSALGPTTRKQPRQTRRQSRLVNMWNGCWLNKR